MKLTHGQIEDLISIHSKLSHGARKESIACLVLNALKELQEHRKRREWPSKDEFINKMVCTAFISPTQWAAFAHDYLTQYTPPQNTTASTESIPDMVSVSREMLEQWRDAFTHIESHFKLCEKTGEVHRFNNVALRRALLSLFRSLASIESVLEGEKSCL